MGAVYEAEQLLGTSRRRVAVKTLHPHLSRDANIEARFRREVGTIAELEHPNTIQVYDFGTTESGILYIVMEFLQGKSLADVLSAQGKMMPDRVQHVLLQICGSLEEAHGRNIVHRDLKPDNIVLIERAGQKDFVKVLDFGIAKRAKEEDKNEQKLTKQGMVLGTPPYMSPEQFTGRPIDARSDIYSLGVMVYEMLTGRLPFNAETAWEWATQHMTQAPIAIESLPEGTRVPAAMRAAVARALAKSAEDRFQTVRSFGEAFGAKTVFEGALTPAPAEAIGMSPRTPGAGNVAFPTRTGELESPRETNSDSSAWGRGPMRQTWSGRAVLLSLAALIGVASVVAIWVAVRGASSGASKEVLLDNASPPAPATSLTPVAVTSGDVPPVASSSPDIPPLSGAGPKMHPSPMHDAASTGAARAEAPSSTQAHSAEPQPSSSSPLVPQPSVSQAIPPQPTTAPSRSDSKAETKYDGTECVKARTLRAAGRTREARPWALACIAKGGSL
jgi:serine/threonine-protein kinase